MADIMPNYQLEIQKFKRALADFYMKIESYKCQYIESIYKQEQALLNIKATEKAIVDTTETLASLVKEHGDTEIDFEILLKGVK